MGRKYSLCCIVLITFVFGVLKPSTANSNSSNVDIFIEGCHLDLPIPEPEKWFGLFVSQAGGKKKSALHPVKLTLSKKLAGIDDFYDYCVKVTKSNNAKLADFKPVVLLKSGIFVAGDIQSAHIPKYKFKELGEKTFVGDAVLPPTEETITITLGSKIYTLSQKTNLDDNAKGSNHVLKLTHNRVDQVLLDVHGNYEAATNFYIIWAGDLDRDGKLDLFANVPDHYATPYHLRLYLSSQASKGNLVHAIERVFAGP